MPKKRVATVKVTTRITRRVSIQRHVTPIQPPHYALDIEWCQDCRQSLTVSDRELGELCSSCREAEGS